MRLRLLTTAALLSVVVGASACDSSSAPNTDAARCALSDKLVPSCGVLWGISTNPSTAEQLAVVEQAVGHPFDLVYRYHDIVGVFPDVDERRAVSDGKVLHIAIAARVYGEARDAVTYGAIASGRYDDSLRAQARGIASLGVPVFLTFEQEGNQKRKLGRRGSAADYKAAWRHVHEVFTSAGATNAVWAWVMTGAAANLDRAGALWPGNDVVDWISWNVYNQSGCGSGTIKPEMFQTFDQAARPFYDWVHEKGPGLGIDPDKPMMVSESGSVLYADNPQLSASWYAQIPTALAALPQLKAVALWDNATSAACDYQFQRDPDVLRAVGSASGSPSFATRFTVPSLPAASPSS